MASRFRGRENSTLPARFSHIPTAPAPTGFSGALRRRSHGNVQKPPPPRIPLKGESGRFAYSTRHGKLAYGLIEYPPATFPQRVRIGTPDNIRLLICGMFILCRSQACHQGCLIGIFSQLFRAGKPDEKTRTRTGAAPRPLIRLVAPLRCKHPQHKHPCFKAVLEPKNKAKRRTRR